MDCIDTSYVVQTKSCPGFDDLSYGTNMIPCACKHESSKPSFILCVDIGMIRYKKLYDACMSFRNDKNTVRNILSVEIKE